MPNHFLHGQASGQLAPEVVDEIDFHPRHRWLRLQKSGQRKANASPLVKLFCALSLSFQEESGLWEESSKYIQDLMGMYKKIMLELEEICMFDQLPSYVHW